MSSEKPPKWTQGQLTAALQYYHTHKGKESQQSVAAAFGIPKFTFSDYVSGKVEVGSRPGPPSVLTKAEEDKLVDYCLHMAKCGYGRTREQVCLTVKKFIDRDGRPNPFEDNMPGRKWWDLFKSGTLKSLCNVQCHYSCVELSHAPLKFCPGGILTLISFCRRTI